MLSANEVRAGMILDVDGKTVEVLTAQHQKIGRGGAKLSVKLRDVGSGASTDQTFSATKRFKRIPTNTQKVQYLYDDAGGYHFMDMESFDELTLARDVIGKNSAYLSDGLIIDLVNAGSQLLSIKLPPSVELKVVEAEPGHRGDTAGSATKSVRLNTGVTIQAPLFVEVGEIVRVSTATGEYQERVSG